MSDTAYLTGILEPLLDEPQKLVVSRRTDEMGVLFTVQCGKDDMGRVIGKEGATANAIRALLRIYGAKNNERINMKLLEPEGFPQRKKRELHEVLSDFTNSKTISG